VGPAGLEPATYGLKGRSEFTCCRRRALYALSDKGIQWSGGSETSPQVPGSSGQTPAKSSADLSVVSTGCRRCRPGGVVQTGRHRRQTAARSDEPGPAYSTGHADVRMDGLRKFLDEPAAGFRRRIEGQCPEGFFHDPHRISRGLFF
jgi:hypothetical protein